MNKYRVKIKYEVGEVISVADGDKAIGTYPDTVSLVSSAPCGEIASALCVSVIATALSNDGKFCRIKDTIVEELNEE